MNLLNKVRVTRGINKMSSGSSAIGNELDMAGYEGVLFIAVGSSVMRGSSNVTLKAAGSTASGGTFVNYSSYAATTRMSNNSFNSKLLCLDVYRPLKRYVKPVVGGASSSGIHTRGVVAIQYNARVPGSTQLRDSTYVGSNATIIAATSS